MLKTIVLLFILSISNFAQTTKSEVTKKAPVIEIAAVKKLRKVIEEKNIVLLKKQLETLRNQTNNRSTAEKSLRTL